MNYWEIIANELSASGWSWGIATAYDMHTGKLFIVDAHHAAQGGRFIVQSNELLTAFLELEQQTKHCD